MPVKFEHEPKVVSGSTKTGPPMTGTRIKFGSAINAGSKNTQQDILLASVFSRILDMTECQKLGGRRSSRCSSRCCCCCSRCCSRCCHRPRGGPSRRRRRPRGGRCCSRCCHRPRGGHSRRRRRPRRPGRPGRHRPRCPRSRRPPGR